jgi:hypothetical protein
VAYVTGQYPRIYRDGQWMTIVVDMSIPDYQVTELFKMLNSYFGAGAPSNSGGPGHMYFGVPQQCPHYPYTFGPC